MSMNLEISSSQFRVFERIAQGVLNKHKIKLILHEPIKLHHETKYKIRAVAPFQLEQLRSTIRIFHSRSANH